MSNFQDALIRQISAKTVNHDPKALKMLFKSARRDSAITEDPTEFVETVRKEREIKIKRPFTLPELRSVCGSGKVTKASGESRREPRRHRASGGWAKNQRDTLKNE